MFGKNLVSIWIGILALSGMFLAGQETWPRTGPGIVIEEVSPHGDEYATVSGYVKGVNPADYVVTCYIEVEDVIWTKPCAASPHTGIDEDS